MQSSPNLTRTIPAWFFPLFFGGSGSGSANGVAIDPSGNIYIVGTTTSVDYPTTVGNQPTACPNSCSYAVVSKFDGNGKLQYSTYLSGNETSGTAIAVDSSGDAYVVGNIQSADLQLTNVFQSIPTNAFLLKLDPPGQHV